MVRFRHLAVILALVSSLLAPTMACALPTAQMTAQEHACCQKMKSNCSSMHMPASHSCCQQSIQANHLDAFQPQSVSVPAAPALAVLPLATMFDWRSLSFERLRTQHHSPPISPPQAVSVLRI